MARLHRARQKGQRSRRIALLVIVLILGVGLSVIATPCQASASVDPSPVQIALQLVTDGLFYPVDLAFPPDGTGRLFILQYNGKILVFDGTKILPTPFLDLSPLMANVYQQPTLVFHPHFIVNGVFFVHYRALSGDSVIARYHISADPNVADPASAQIVLTLPHSGPDPIHQIGQLTFGPDGYLYVASGEGQDGDPNHLAQNLNDLHGKILRLDVDNGSPYSIPPANPFFQKSQARGEVWVRGLRNPWRLSFDRLTGDLFIGDSGRHRREELDFQPASSPGGENYGWSRMEGSLCFDPPSDCNDGAMVLPIIEYDHVPDQDPTNDNQECVAAIIGGFRYRGSRYPQLYGTVLYGDFCKGTIWGARDDEVTWNTIPLIQTPTLITTFAEDEDGELYVADALGGRVYKIVVTNTAVPTLTSVSPSVVMAGRGSFTLELQGDSFVPGAHARWNDADLATNYVSRHRLTASVPAQLVALGGIGKLTVLNPPPGGGSSNELALPIKDFDIVASPTSARTRPGQPASFTIMLHPHFGDFGQKVLLSCSASPATASCSFSRNNILLGAQPVSTALTLTVQTVPRSGNSSLPSTQFLALALFGLPIGIAAGVPLLCLKRKAKVPLLLTMVCLVLLASAACSTGGAPRPIMSTQSVTVGITGTSGLLTRTTTVVVTVE